MLMAVKNQIRIVFLSVKYALMREMLNKGTFIMNIVFMILNNSFFIIQWVVIYSIKEDIGGYSFNQVILLWAIASSTYGFSHFFFRKAYSLSDIINTGKLDSYLVQPKNVLISVITSDIEVSAIGDLLYGLIAFCISGFSIAKFLLFILFTICGGLMTTAISVILSSLAFYINKSDMITDTINGAFTHFATYPGGIFNGVAKIILYTIIPVGIINYVPVEVISKFDLKLTLLVILSTIVIILLSFLIFNKGLKRYSSSNLMISKI